MAADKAPPSANRRSKSSGLTGKKTAFRLVQLRVDALGQFAADAVHAGDVFHGGVAHTLHAAEARQQALTPLRPDAVDVLERRSNTRLVPLGALAGDGEAV